LSMIGSVIDKSHISGDSAISFSLYNEESPFSFYNIFFGHIIRTHDIVRHELHWYGKVLL